MSNLPARERNDCRQSVVHRLLVNKLGDVYKPIRALRLDAPRRAYHSLFIDKAFPLEFDHCIPLGVPVTRSREMVLKRRCIIKYPNVEDITIVFSRKSPHSTSSDETLSRTNALRF